MFSFNEFPDLLATFEKFVISFDASMGLRVIPRTIVGVWTGNTVVLNHVGELLI